MQATLDEIKNAVRQLPPRDHELLRKWLIEENISDPDQELLSSFSSAAAHSLILVDSPDANLMRNLLAKEASGNQA
jgi:hypothetical protein